MATAATPGAVPHLSEHLAARLLAGFVVLHGIAHFAGTTTSLQLASDGMTAEYLGGAWVISDPAQLRILAVAWAAVGLTVIAAGIDLWRRPGPARRTLAVATIVSLAFCVLALWAAIIGVVVNIVLLALTAVGPTAIFGEDAEI